MNKKKKLVTVQDSFHTKKNSRRECKRVETIEGLSYSRATAENTNGTHRYTKLNLRLATRTR